MLKIILPRHLLSWLMAFKGEDKSLPSVIIQILFYIKDNEITLEDVMKKNEERMNDRTKRFNGNGED